MADDDPYPDCFYNYERELADEECARFVSELTGADADAVVEHRRELVEDHALASHLEAALARTDSRPDTVAPNWRDILYVLVRTERPDVVVETGIYDGLSSAYLLAGLAANDHGTLVSIDVEDPELLPSDVEPVEAGWAVPDHLRSRWDRRIGDARELLPAVADEFAIDLFVHDSNHDADHMTFEFETAGAAMDAGALLLADNVQYNDAFASFAADNLARVTTVVNADKSLQRDGGVVENDEFGGGVVT